MLQSEKALYQKSENEKKQSLVGLTPGINSTVGFTK
jgi:hypothetical protein